MIAVATNHHALNFDQLLQQIDRECGNLPTSIFKRFSFELDGIGVEVRRITHEKSDKVLISATIGRLPFSIESPERRDAIRTLVMATRRLPRLHFSIDTAGKITAGGLFDPANVVAPDFIFHPLSLFLQEGRPFFRLIGLYLQAEPALAATA